jgi:hypothetical protein
MVGAISTKETTWQVVLLPHGSVARQMRVAIKV